MARLYKKRRPSSQLTPENIDDPIEDEVFLENEDFMDNTKTQRPKRKARISRTYSGNDERLKDIFSGLPKILVPEMTTNKLSSNYDKKISSLNRSLLKSIGKVLETQSNKDLRYLFEQYEVYLKQIKE